MIQGDLYWQSVSAPRAEGSGRLLEAHQLAKRAHEQGHRWLLRGPRRQRRAAGTLASALLVLLVGSLAGEVRAATDPRNVVTQHNDNSRSGAYLAETRLTPSNVRPGTFGKLYSRQVDGDIVAQPLYVRAVATPTHGVKNLFFIATAKNMLYAFDADDTRPDPAGLVWNRQLCASRQLPSNGPAGCAICTETASGYVGVSSTPVIDPTTNTMYVVARCWTTTCGNSQDGANYLYAINLADGTNRMPPKRIEATAPDNPSVRFDVRCHRDRPGLLLLNGVVYVAYGTFSCDGWCPDGPYHGWVMGYRASDLTQVAVFATEGARAGIWQSGNGLAGAPDGTIYLETGNDWRDVMAPLGDSFVKLRARSTPPGLTLDRWFTPNNASDLRNSDSDLSSGGPMLLPGGRLIGGGKQGKYYVLQRDTMELSQNEADPQLCKAACEEDSACRAWTYVQPGLQGPQARCWLKNAVPPPTTNTCCVSGVKGGNEEWNRDRVGSDYSNFNLSGYGPQLCQAACDGDPACRAWTYVQPGLQGPQARCWLKNAVPPSTPNGGTVSGVKGGGKEWNRDRVGSDYSNFDLSGYGPQLCQAACDGDPACRTWTYVQPGLQGPQARCWLKNAVPPPTPNGWTVSGVKGGGKEWRIDRAGSDYSNFGIEGPDGFQAFLNTWHINPAKSPCLGDGPSVGIDCYVAPSRYDKSEYHGPNIHGGPIYWQGPDPGYGLIYKMPEKDYLKAFKYDLSTYRVSEKPVLIANVRPADGMPGGSSSLSANGNRNGIVWTSLPLADAMWNNARGRLIAFDASTLSQLWSDDGDVE